VAESHGPGLAAKQIRLTLDVPDRLTIAGNPFLLHQALDNLVQNAIDFSPQGGALQIAGKAEPDRVHPHR